MTVLVQGDSLLPDRFGVEDYEIRATDDAVLIEIRGGNGVSTALEASGVISFRFSYEEVYEGYLEGSLNRLLILERPTWGIRYRDEDSFRGEFVREKKFYHLNIPDVGIFECWASAITRH